MTKFASVALRIPLLAAIPVAMAAAVLLPASAFAVEPPPVAVTGDPALAPEVAQLREQIAQLRQTLERVDQRLQQIQHAGAAGANTYGAAAPAAANAVPVPAPAPVPSTASAPALDAHQQSVLQEQVRTADALSAWQALHNGMRQEDVRRLLGEPQSTLVVGNRTGWVYAYRSAGRGSVFFDGDGTVVSMMVPGQGTVHLY